MIEYDWIARAQARRYQATAGGCYDLDDLIQEARLGILHGMTRYREGAGASRETWASIWAHSYIHRYVEQQRNVVRVPTGADVGRRKGQLVRLQTSNIDDEAFRLQAPECEPREHRLQPAFAELPERWRYVLTQRYAAERTMQSLADERGCKKQAIQNVINRALARLKDELCRNRPVQQLAAE
jgi:RNA polymerase sigma factor (sigma-70 family)